VTEVADVVVIGLGPGGEALAGELAGAGLSVVGVEARLVGGECPYFGCIPSKMIIRAGNALAEARRVPGLAGAASVTAGFATVADRIRTEATAGWDDTAAATRLTDTGARLVRGRATLTGPREVSVAGADGRTQLFTAHRAVVLNPGSEPRIPPVPGLAGTPFWTNRDILAAGSAPESMVVLGGGAVGAELAQAFARFGTKVSIVDHAPRLLAAEEPESGDLAGATFRDEGIKIYTGVRAQAVSHSAGGFAVDVGDRILRAETLLVATGRTSNLAKAGVDALDLDFTGPYPETDQHLQIVDGVYLIGDAAGHGAFTHMSMYHAGIVAGHILGEPRGVAEYHAVPRVTFTDPEIGAVGLTEAAAREQGLRVRTGWTDLTDSTRGWIHKSGNQGFIKVVEDADRGILVGATAAGPAGGEMLSLLALAVHARIPVGNLRGMIYAYPTFHRAIDAALHAIK